MYVDKKIYGGAVKSPIKSTIEYLAVEKMENIVNASLDFVYTRDV